MKSNHQEITDKIGIISDMVEELSGYLDKFFAENDEEDTSRLEAVWPGHKDINKKTVKAIADLYRKMLPPDEYDPADRDLRG